MKASGLRPPAREGGSGLSRWDEGSQTLTRGWPEGGREARDQRRPALSRATIRRAISPIFWLW